MILTVTLNIYGCAVLQLKLNTVVYIYNLMFWVALKAKPTPNPAWSGAPFTKLFKSESFLVNVKDFNALRNEDAKLAGLRQSPVVTSFPETGRILLNSVMHSAPRVEDISELFQAIRVCNKIPLHSRMDVGLRHGRRQEIAQLAEIVYHTEAGSHVRSVKNNLENYHSFNLFGSRRHSMSGWFGTTSTTSIASGSSIGEPNHDLDPGIFRIIATSIGQGGYLYVASEKGAFNVHCELDADKARGGWTEILSYHHISTNPIVSATGFGNPHDKFFIGKKNLFDLNRHENDAPRPLVFWFYILMSTSAVPFIAIYDNVVFDNPTDLKIISLGRYHGNAGNNFIHNVNETFVTDSDKYFWGSTSSDEKIKVHISGSDWPGMPNTDITKLHLYVRSQDYDRNYTCPPILGVDHGSLNTTINGLDWRGEGAVASYTCHGDLFMEGPGESMEGKTTEGTIVCQRQDDGTLAWNRTVELPCRLTCPDNYAKTEDGDSCVSFSTEPVVGISRASLRCRDDGASLANIERAADLDTAERETYYFTAHVSQKGNNDYMPPPPDADCENQCDTSNRVQCLALKIEGGGNLKKKRVSCEDGILKYACQKPAYCPVGFHAYNGLCYHVIQATGENLKSFEEAQLKCGDMASSLAFPESRDALEYIADLVRSILTAVDGKELFVIVNKRGKFWIHF
ncbi:uncharacterized protein [Penaeus vannamei]|uniref:uncharacterized protein n=1 Tax=Penaeus vannamei TaxID=6689 RepID=UPI00387F6D33